ncbi:putative ATP-dependent helicase [Psilocybe cubensis]|uniref:ATP-dependent helicase n=2 Tax=Psilocybe cubensis TaxID=181762 RepID=A0ACB8GLJ1_PSICU|nr:putative ATP-dependent helicase [Psilocybe cubensis]KAH9476541.1 putative ATP-dependent helicase [Psilocybe cubensis]
MREIVSNHQLCVRTYPTNQNDAFVPNVNVTLLTRLIHDGTANLLPGRDLKGKRKASNDIEQEERESKRARNSANLTSNTEESTQQYRVTVSYPTISSLRSQDMPHHGEMAPILHHLLNIHYDSDLTQDIGFARPDPVSLDIWNREDDELQAALLALNGSSLDLGIVRITQDGEHVVIVSGKGEWLLITPSLRIDANSHDIQSESAVDLLLAIRTLQLMGRSHLEAKLKVLPPSESFFFSLQLEYTASIVLPAIMKPFSSKRVSKKDVHSRQDARRRFLTAAWVYDDMHDSGGKTMTVSSFYSTMGPAPPLPSPEATKAMQPVALSSTLLPFQLRSVAWLLEREGISVTSDGKLVPQESSGQFSFWSEVKDGERTWYYNRLSGELAEEAPELPTIHGAMLAEEPGLGKTVETIALMLLNPAPKDWNPSLTRWDPDGHLDVKAIKSTLIVTPPSLASQWKTELANHAPSLKVLMYDGWTKVKVPISKTKWGLERFKKVELESRPKKKGKSKARNVEEDGSNSRSDDGEVLEWCEYVHQFDVVITTYNVLRSEIHVARPPPDRPKREEASYHTSSRLRSPLVMVEWKRVVMDEVQMVGGGQAAEMVSLIPRLSSLAVSGTPAKSQMSDLIHVLKFLRIDQLVGDLRLWNRLLKPGFAKDFAAFLKHYGIRTMKSCVTSELTIPQQTRYLVGIDLGRVEQHVYDQTLEAILQQLGLDARGIAATEGWQVNGNLLRSAIRRLRGICTHPQVGQLQKRGDGLYKPGALKTIDAVLQSMRDQNWKNLMEDWKAKIQLMIRYAQLQQKDDTVPNHQQNALRTLVLVEEDTNKHLEEIKDALTKHDAKGKILIEEAAQLRQQREVSAEAGEPNEKGKGKARDSADGREDDGGEDEDPEEKGLPKTPAGEEHRVKRRTLKSRLREGYVLLHRVKFLQGDVYHVLGRSNDEDAAYQAAEQLRRQLLKVTENEAAKAMSMLNGPNLKPTVTLNDLIIDLPLLGKGGIRSTDLMEEANTIVDEVLNDQSDLTWEWRTHIMELLTKPLNPGGAEDDVDGQEYQRTLDDQGEAETYLQAYAAILSDRREALVNERTLLAAHEVREKQVRQTKAALKAATAAAEALDVPEGLDIKPEHEVLHEELSSQRKDILIRLDGRSVKSILIDLNGVAVKILQENNPEKVIVREAIDKLRRFISEQNSLHEKLDADLALLRKAFNQRILYFRQLQEISDSVADVEWEEASAADAGLACVTEKNELEAKINTTRARQRYLDNLAKNQDEGIMDEDDKTCILCRSEFIRGFITQCAHVFCEGCMRAWLLRKEGKTCPVCRVAINPDSVQRFTVNAAQIEPPPQPVLGEPAPQSRRQIEYNRIDPAIFKDIQTMETYGDFGSKIQTLIRHISYIKHIDPGAKSIVFSAWADSLHIVERAFSENGIPCLRIDQGSKNAAEKFAADPDILVLLLHGERENAGLNVTCASRVFLLESVVHHSFEIQAIARIDRLGQTRPTEVYCYYAEGTIERNILDLAARKGLSLYTKENSHGTVNVSPFNQDNEQDVDNPERRKGQQRGDFIHKIDDMLSILFPHMFEDLEYLLPPSVALPFDPSIDEVHDVTMADNVSASITRALNHAPNSATTNVVAGPSRLR